MRSWSVLGNLLAADGFNEVHRRRRHLTLDDKSCRFMLRSSLWLPDDEESAAASAYWSGRLAEPEDALDFLLFSALDEDTTIRARAATQLAKYPTPDVEERLIHLALVDDDDRVRAHAISSLGAMRTDALRRRLFREAESRGTYRIRAIHALRAFPDAETGSFLRQLVVSSDEALAARQAAIAVLSAFNTTESVDALIDIALRDPDEEDRAAAANGLSVTRTEERNQQILATLGPLRRAPILRWLVGAISLAFAASAVGMVVAFVIYASATLGLVMLPFVVALPVGVFALTWWTARRLQRVQERTTREGGSKPGLLTMVLLTVVAAPLCLMVHGLAHAMLRRWRRAVLLFAVELLGVFLISIASAFTDVLSGLLQFFYVFIGGALVIGSYFFDVLPVMAETVFRSAAVEHERRKEMIYRHLLRNAEVGTLLLRQFRSDTKAERDQARHLLGRFAQSLPASQLIQLLDTGDAFYTATAARGFRGPKDHDTVRQLESLWGNATPALRNRIADILCRSPTPSSIEALERVRQDLPASFNLRFAFAKAQLLLRFWPLHFRAITLVSVPAVVLFIVFGYGALNNQAWPQLIAVDRYLHAISLAPRAGDDANRRDEARMAATIVFLARTYPIETGPRLIEYMHDPRVTTHPRIRASVARGLIELLLTDSSYHYIDQSIVGLDTAIADALLRGNQATFVRSIEDLAGLARSRPSDANVAIDMLSTLILGRSPDSAEAWKPLAVRALASTGASRALPALNKLLDVRGESPLARVAHAEFGAVVASALDSARRDQEPATRARQLLATLDPLSHATAAQINLVKRFADSAAAARPEDQVLAEIASDPSAESGYASLFVRYEDKNRYREAVGAFAALASRYPNSIWPRVYVARVEHERITDSAAFARAYDELAIVRKMAPFAELRRRDPDAASAIDANFVENALSANRFADVERVGDSVVKNPQLPLDRRLNAAIFMYFARVAQGDPSRASDALSRVERVARDLPTDFYNNWVYPGTRTYIMTRFAEDAIRSPLLSLCKEQFWLSDAALSRAIDMNRSMLARLRR